MTWLESIQADLKEVIGEDAVEPEYGRSTKRDHVVGVADQSLRKLFCLFLQNEKQARAAMEAALWLNDEEQETKLREAMRFKIQSGVIREIFWISCRQAFPELWDKPRIGIRKGWEIVWIENDGEEDFGIFSAILGASALEALLRGSLDGEPNKTAMRNKSSSRH